METGNAALSELGVNMIRNIRIEGFKSIVSQILELGRVNCFIGANGVGKSNVLEAIGILGAAAVLSCPGYIVTSCKARSPSK